MASFVGSVRNIMGDSWWAVKVAVLSAAVFYVLYIEYDYPPNDQTILMFKGVVTALLLGVSSVCMNRNINNKEPFMPGILSIPELLFRTLISSVLVIPGLVAAYFLFNYLATFELEIAVKIVIYAIAISVISPFVVIPVVLYSARSNVFDALNIKIILDGSGNVMVQALSYMIQYAIIGGIVILSVYYLLLQMLGDHVALLIWKSIVIVITFISVFSFVSDMYGDSIPEIKVSENKKTKLSKEEALARKKESSRKKNRAGGDNRAIGDNLRRAKPSRLDRYKSRHEHRNDDDE